MGRRNISNDAAVFSEANKQKGNGYILHSLGMLFSDFYEKTTLSKKAALEKSIVKMDIFSIHVKTKKWRNFVCKTATVVAATVGTAHSGNI